MVPAYTPIYLTYPPGIGYISTVYGMQQSGATLTAYMQHLSKRFPPPAHMPPGTERTPADYIRIPGAGPSPAAYIQPSGITHATTYAQPSNIEYTPTSYATPGYYMQPLRPISAVYVQP